MTKKSPPTESYRVLIHAGDKIFNVFSSSWKSCLKLREAIKKEIQKKGLFVAFKLVLEDSQGIGEQKTLDLRPEDIRSIVIEPEDKEVLLIDGEITIQKGYLVNPFEGMGE